LPIATPQKDIKKEDRNHVNTKYPQAFQEKKWINPPTITKNISLNKPTPYETTLNAQPHFLLPYI